MPTSRVGPFKENTLLPGMRSTFKHTHTHKICPCFDIGALIATLFCKKSWECSNDY